MNEWNDILVNANNKNINLLIERDPDKQNIYIYFKEKDYAWITSNVDRVKTKSLVNFKPCNNDTRFEHEKPFFRELTRSKKNIKFDFKGAFKNGNDKQN